MLASWHLDYGQSSADHVQDKDEESSQLASNLTGELTLRDELNMLLQKSSDPKSSSAAAIDEFKWIKQEFILFKNTGKRTENLQKLYEALLSIKPTSTDVERVFSVSSGFCTKIRSRLSDKSLTALVFLKNYKLISNKEKN